MNLRKNSLLLLLLYSFYVSIPLTSLEMDRKELDLLSYTTTNINDINYIDRLSIFPYSEPINMISDIFTYSAILAPSALLATSTDQWIKIGTIYTESLLLTWGLKELGKSIINRNRPYVYFSNYPEKEIINGDYLDSFPSGHTALAFTGATFNSYVFSKYFKSSPWKKPVIISSYALALGTAVTRVLSGNHYITDVVAGALLGTFSGYIVPWLHTLWTTTPKDKESTFSSLSLVIVPSGINVKLSF